MDDIVALASGGQASTQAYDYRSLDSKTAESLRQIANRIRKRGAATIISTGVDLREAKATLGHGHFHAWLDAEFGWSERTAQNYMQAAAVFGSKSETVADVPPVVIYKLAAPSTPPAVRKAVLGRLKAGNLPTKAEVDKLVAEARQEAKIERLPPKKRAATRRKIAASKNKFEQHRREQERQLAEEKAAQQRIAERLLSKFDAADLAQLIAELKAIWWGETLAVILREGSRSSLEAKVEGGGS